MLEALWRRCEDIEREVTGSSSITNLFGRYNSSLLHALYAVVNDYKAGNVWPMIGDTAIHSIRIHLE